MGFKVVREITQPCMEGGVEVHAPGEQLELGDRPELGGRLVVVEVADKPPPVAAPEPRPAGKSGK